VGIEKLILQETQKTVYKQKAKPIDPEAVLVLQSLKVLFFT
jgi:hypothetical protein